MDHTRSDQIGALQQMFLIMTIIRDFLQLTPREL